MKIVKPSYQIIMDCSGEEMLKKIERIARTCYKSEDKITKDSAFKFIKGLLDVGHESIVEHCLVTVRFTTERITSQCMTRHRLSSFAQESTRWCNYSKGKFGNEISVIDIAGSIKNDNKMNVALQKGTLKSTDINNILVEWEKAIEDSEKHYMKMLELGASTDVARSVLPMCLKTEINMTANLREWRAFFKLRCEQYAHGGIRELTLPLLADFHNRIPVVFDDLYDNFIKEGKTTWSK